MKKVLMIVMNNFINDSRVIKEANTLGENGYIVKVLALYRSDLKEIETFNSFKVKRIYLSTREKLSNTNRLIQLIKYFEFYRKCLKEAKIFKPDIIHIHDIAPLPIGVKLKKQLNCKLIYDSHELWSQSSEIKKNIINKLLSRYEKKSIKKADEVITVSYSSAKYLEKVYKLERDVKLIRNTPYYTLYDKKYDHFRKKYNIKSNEKIVLYQGILSKGRGLEKLINMTKYLNPLIKIVILGDGILKEKLIKSVKENNLEDRVFFHNAVPQDILHEYTNSADLGICLIENICLSYFFALPNKLFEYIQFELPVLSSNFPDMKKIIEEYSVGRTVEPNIEVIAREINNILLSKETIEVYKSNCKKAKLELSWNKESEKLLALYKNLL